MRLKITPLYDVHKALKAKFTEFAGWEMPALYKPRGLMEEHRAVRNTCGIFDVSHMGEILISGARALEAVELVTTNNASAVKDWQCQYTLICNEDGGVIDDVVLYRVNAERFMLCVNGANTDKVFKWLDEKIGDIVKVRDASSEYTQLALQGPLAQAILQPHTEADLSEIKYYHFKSTYVCNENVLLSRTGYTGEDGFEIYLEPALTIKVWKVFFDAVRKSKFELLPCGLGARDTLRLEMGFPLYGLELDEDTTPLEAGLGRFVDLDRDGESDFIGKAALLKQRDKGIKKTLVGFEMTDKGIARGGAKILSSSGAQVGSVTSGTFSPSLERAIGMAYVTSELSEPGTELKIDIRGSERIARIVKRPFYTRKTNA